MIDGLRPHILSDAAPTMRDDTLTEPGSDLPDRVERLLAALLDLNPDERDEVLERLCAEHPDLADELRGAYEQARNVEHAGVGVTDSDHPPDRVGPYKILDVLGEGGMGTVYLAEQKEPVRRRVALKVIKLGMDSKEVLARFELERQALAVMSHAVIAKMFEAGATEQGQPFFVMELVEGVPLTDYCDEHRLSMGDRIRIFQQVCHGVQHAHQKGVLHRDLKPGNILVTRKNDQHVVKIIDFGIARATDQQLIENTVFTQQGQMVGTPEYMSPEQAGGSALDIDTRTDIYSLGVVLYELLTGDLPFPSAYLRKGGLLEVQRIIREQEPSKPSTKVSSAGDAASDSAHRRRLTSQALLKQLRGDLDWIVMRAMAKEPERRYGSPLNLAEDLGRYLDHEPVLAGPPSATYKLRKIVRKYRVQVLAGLLVFVAMAAGTVGTTWFMLDAREQAEIAKTQRAAARAARDLARKRLDNFDRLAVMVQLEEADKEFGELRPAWPNRMTAMKTWLRRRGLGLQQELGKVRDALRRLELEAVRQPPAEERAKREAHPKYPLFCAQRKKVASLRRAMAVRRVRGEVPTQEPPAGIPEDVDAINDLAWPKIDPDRPADAYGDELVALALARRAVELATKRGPCPPLIRGMYGWALFANGLDEAAVAEYRTAIAQAEGDDRGVLDRYFVKLKQAIADAAGTLARSEAELDLLERQITDWHFANEADGFLHRTLLELEPDLVAFLGDRGPRVEVERRLAWARVVEDLTKRHPKARVTWDDARDALRRADGVNASELYGAKYHPHHPIDLEPQMGLVPIGMNPITRLWEFYHLRSAFDPRTEADPAAIEIPTHNADGSVDVGEKTGIVFVLLPGGNFTMGGQNTDPLGKNFDKRAEVDESVHEETVAPFFLARHELTQGQWLRLSLEPNPSHYWAGAMVLTKRVTMRHPVEHVDWHQCISLVRTYGLILPHENQWEYGCRAGKSTAWFPGDEPSDLRDYANILDASARKHATWSGAHVAFDDGHVIHAPVGSFKANAFGLYDVHGNIWEWCSNLHGGTSKQRVPRGGSCQMEARYARSAHRSGVDPTARDDGLGLRVARSLDR